MPKVTCIEDVIMTDGKQAFTKGKVYKTYKYILRDWYDLKPTIAAKNDFGKRHIIFDETSEKTKDFYTKHFEDVKVEVNNFRLYKGTNIRVKCGKEIREGKITAHDWKNGMRTVSYGGKWWCYRDQIDEIQLKDGTWINAHDVL